MILEIINKTNEYSAETKFMFIESSNLAAKLEVYVNMGRLDVIVNLQTMLSQLSTTEAAGTRTKHIENSLNNYCKKLCESETFSEEFSKLFIERITILILEHTQINFTNCYSDLIAPLLDSCNPNQITAQDLKGLIHEFHPAYIVLVANHTKVVEAEISLDHLLDAIKADMHDTDLIQKLDDQVIKICERLAIITQQDEQESIEYIESIEHRSEKVDIAPQSSSRKRQHSNDHSDDEYGAKRPPIEVENFQETFLLCNEGELSFIAGTEEPEVPFYASNDLNVTTVIVGVSESSE